MSIRRALAIVAAMLFRCVLPCLSQVAAPQLAEYVGQYRAVDDPDTVTSVYLDGGKLYEESERTARLELIPDGSGATDTFNFAESHMGMHLVFEREAGAVTGLKMVSLQGGRMALDEKRFSNKGIRLNHFVDYGKTEAMVPVRDGAKLHVVIFRPAGSETGAPLPFLFTRTPYGIDHVTSNSINSGKPELAASGYIWVYGDIRGRYESQGQFVMNRPVVIHNGPKDVDETTDTRDTIDWLLKNVPNNSGKVGVLGVSYPGFLAMMAGIDAHPAVKAISPQAPMTDVWMGDDFFHNGAFRETYGYDYVQQLEGQKTDVRAESTEDTYEFFLRNVNFAGAAKSAKMEDLPTAKVFLTQPSYTKFWQDMAVEKRLTKVEVPTLEVGGWWDQEDMWGTQAEYAALKPHDTNGVVQMVLGPWNHGGWGGSGRSLGGPFGHQEFGEPTGTEYRKTIEFPFFELYLKGKPGYDLKAVASFRTGENAWHRYAAWPPQEGFTLKELYLAPGGGLSWTRADTGPVAGYVADPANPIPYRNRPIQATYGTGSKWRTWLVEDQRFVDGRKDLAEFKGPVLEKDVTVTGDVKANLFLSTTGSDADWVAKLIDVAPDGTQTMIVDEIFRGRYRESFEKPEPITPGKVTEYTWSLHGADHTFLKGHRMMVEVQSSWFPLYDRNPQTFVPNIMTAPASAYKAQTVTIYGNSHLDFGVAQ